MIREHQIRVDRTARYATVGEAGPAVREVWFVCHGYGQLAPRFARHCEALADGTRLVVAPEALNRFYLDAQAGGRHADAKVGATWMTREDRLAEIDDYVRYLDALSAHVLGELGRGDVVVRVLGFSQGVATVSRWLAFGHARVDHLILWAGLLPHDVPLADVVGRLRGVRLSLVLGSHDDFARPDVVARQEATLRAADVRYELLTFDGGHQLDAATLARLAE